MINNNNFKARKTEKKVNGTDKENNIPELTKKAAFGDMDAFSELYNCSYNDVYHTVRTLIKDEDMVQDVIQESYIKCFKNLGQLKKNESFIIWMKKIAVNTAKNYLRKKKPINFSELENESGVIVAGIPDEDKECLPDLIAEQREAARLLEEILSHLDEEQLRVVRLFYYEQMSVKEIADLLSCNENTVKSRLFYARKKIEKEVRRLEAKGIKLYSLAPAIYLRVLLKNLEVSDAGGLGTGITETVQEAGEGLSALEGVLADASGSMAGKMILGKKLVTGIAATIICAGICLGIGLRREPLKQEIQEMLPETGRKQESPVNSQEMTTRDGEEQKIISGKNGEDLTGNTGKQEREFTVTPTPTVTPMPTVTPTPTVTSLPTAASAPNSPVSEGVPNGLQGQGNDAGNSAEVQNPQAPNTEPVSEESQDSGHEHNWVEQTKTVHHEAEGHYVTKIIQEAYDEPVYENRVFCNVCHEDVTTNKREHEQIHSAGYSFSPVLKETIHHEAVTEQEWVEDKAAYDETVVTGHICSECGSTQ